jgi:hypothetical protein
MLLSVLFIFLYIYKYASLYIFFLLTLSKRSTTLFDSYDFNRLYSAKSYIYREVIYYFLESTLISHVVSFIYI